MRWISQHTRVLMSGAGIAFLRGLKLRRAGPDIITVVVQDS